MNLALDLIGVSHTYAHGSVRVEALKDVTLGIDRGEMVAVMGPSGSGKSTLLSLAGGLEQATTGIVRVDGAELGQRDATALAELRRKKVGYVFQDYNVLPSLTAAENVALPLELDGVGQRKARKQALQALSAVDMARMADRFPDNLSGGEQQRVAIARAMVGDRFLLLADEPTGALDTLTGENVMRLLSTYCNQGGTALYVTHEAAHAAWADRVLFLRDGRLADQARHAGPELLLAEGRVR